MRKLTNIFLIFISVLFLSISSSKWLGEQKAIFPIFLGLVDCEGKPCYAGIEILKTTQHDTRLILEKLPGSILQNDVNKVIFTIGAIDWIDYLADYDYFVYKIRVHFRPNTIPLGAFIVSLGIPCSIHHAWAEHTYADFDQTFDYFGISYGDVNIWVQSETMRLEQSAYVTAIEFYPHPGQILFDEPVNNTCNLGLPPWRGFTTYISNDNR